MGGQSGAAVTRLQGYHQDVGSNPAVARNEKTHIGQTPAQKVPQLCDVHSVINILSRHQKSRNMYKLHIQKGNPSSAPSVAKLSYVLPI